MNPGKKQKAERQGNGPNDVLMRDHDPRTETFHISTGSRKIGLIFSVQVMDISGARAEVEWSLDGDVMGTSSAEADGRARMGMSIPMPETEGHFHTVVAKLPNDMPGYPTKAVWYFRRLPADGAPAYEGKATVQGDAPKGGERQAYFSESDPAYDTFDFQERDGVLHMRYPFSVRVTPLLPDGTPVAWTRSWNATPLTLNSDREGRCALDEWIPISLIVGRNDWLMAALPEDPDKRAHWDFVPRNG